MNEADRSDIQAAIGGDGEAYERLVRRYESQISRLMWRFSRDPGECEELVQDVFVDAYFSLAGYREEAPFIHWLKRIAVRRGYRLWKEKKKQQRQVPLMDADGAEAVAAKPSSCEAAGILDALLARLTVKDRLVLTLFYFERASMKEIAKITGWSIPMVKMRAHRARNKLTMIAERENILEEWS